MVRPVDSFNGKDDDTDANSFNKNDGEEPTSSSADESTQLSDSAKKKNPPPIPTAAKPGTTSMILKLNISQDFETYIDLIRQLGLIQTQIYTIQPLITLTDFLLLSQKEANYAEIEPIISNLEDLFKTVETKVKELPEINEKYKKKIINLNDDTTLALTDLRQTFEKNIIYWIKLKEFREKCASEIRWIEKTEEALFFWKNISVQNYSEMKEFCSKTKVEMNEHDVKLKEFFTKHKTMREKHEITQYEVFSLEYNIKGHALHKHYKNISRDVEMAQKAYEFYEKVQKMIKEKKNKLAEYDLSGVQASENIQAHETYVQELKAFLVEAENVKKEIAQQQSELKSYNPWELDFTLFKADLERTREDVQSFCKDIMQSIEKEKKNKEALSEFNTFYEAIKTWIDQQYLLLSKIEMFVSSELPNENLSNMNALMEKKKVQIAEIQEKGEALITNGFPSTVYKTTEIQEKWEKITNLLSEKNSEIKNFKIFIEKNEVIQQQTKRLAETSITDKTGLKEILTKSKQLDKDIIDAANLASTIKREYSKYADQTDACVENLFSIQNDLNNNILKAAKSILSKEIDVFNIHNVNQLHQHFATAKNATHLTARRSSKLDVSFRTFWQNRKSQVCGYAINADNTYDDNWLKRMSKIPKFDIPQKYTSFDTSINAVGMDLGTSSCCVAANRKNKIDVAAIDNTGERTLPSYVGFDEAHVKCGKVVLDRFGTYSKSTIFDSKRIIGKKLGEIDKDPMWPFDVVSNKGKVELVAEGYKKTIIKKTPEEIASILLLHMQQTAVEFQGKGTTSIVITIPAAFTESQKEATLAAAKLAKLENVSLLPEPVAASFAYFIDRPLPENSTILLFDFGGGTLDICIFEIINSEFRIIRNTGDANIGGRNFDNILYDYFKAELFTRHKINVETKNTMKHKLMLKCQAIKHMLSTSEEDGINIDDYNSNIEGPPIMLTRQQFESLSAELLEDIKILLTYATESLQHPVERVLHVGGSSRLPMIKEMLETMFPNAEQCCEKHPEEVVAVGAAYYSYHLALNNINY